ncbi:hypothetical protein ABT160_30050 [Streptomyces sp. NPDC001941]|uniref:hypothetical protein n=1 Tax=Streptomyces sp. NPDC001941 TaxID=3154659 RepID=UPI0033174BD9
MDSGPARARVYGYAPDDPDGYAREGRAYVALKGGPLDGLLLDITGEQPAELADGALLVNDLGTYGAGGRSDYVPDGSGEQVWIWRGDRP